MFAFITGHKSIVEVAFILSAALGTFVGTTDKDCHAVAYAAVRTV